ncbi:CLUMA_CG007686, isoform A [Clunio marinus]|uniref:CLUMA_CG007686, isoform A n=1 Tax=Clunio marinus TaxID=568069 RepID=A0A1J1I6X1_9DIPT|nr:CLUMA_CG007686, isoform A [Clunio marinus]
MSSLNNIKRELMNKLVDCFIALYIDSLMCRYLRSNCYPKIFFYSIHSDSLTQKEILASNESDFSE